MNVLLMLGLLVAVWRVTRLLVRDEFPPVRKIREWMIATFAVVNGEGEIVAGRRWGGLGYAVGYVWTCPWCMSVWVGLGVWAAADWRLSVPYPWLLVAAGSGLSGVLEWVESGVEQRWKLREAELVKAARR